MKLPSLRPSLLNSPGASRVAQAVLALVAASVASAQPSSPKPVPRVQALPLPNSEISFQRDGVELARYYFATNLNRPFLYPIVGPSGRSLTRMGHPHDPVTHSHHNSIWISHHDIEGHSAWEDRGEFRVVHQRVESLTDADAAASAVVVNHWQTDTGDVVMEERRRMTIQPLQRGEWQLTIDLRFMGRDGEVTIGKTPFGMVGVRMARSIGVNDGGGTIRNSAGGVNEKEVLWKSARWVDYSGPITPRATEGITLMDHPSNPNHPTVFHVRNDGWMGASLTFDGPRVLKPGQPLNLRYGFYVHSGLPSTNAIHARWLSFAGQPIPPWPAPKQ